MEKRATRSAAAGAADLLSGLGDDILVRILELLPDAGDAVRTGALSRRWRGLWTRLPALRFASTSRPSFSADAQRFASFVSTAIALRAAHTDPAVQHLAISLVTPPRYVERSAAKTARNFIRDAVQHDVKSFSLELHRSPDDDVRPCPREAWGRFLHSVKILDDLPRSAKMETMRLALGGTSVTLPAAATAPSFASLKDLTLESMAFAVGSGHRLTRLVSPACCPLLQKLRLRDLSFPPRPPCEDMELLLEAEALLELSWELQGAQPQILRLRTPRLRVLHTVDCGLEELAISAPKLEELLFLGCGEPDRITGIDGGLPCVRRLKVGLTSHAYNFDGGHHEEIEDYDEENDDAAFRLLSCCTSVAILDVNLYVVKDEEYRSVHIIEGRIPRLPQVTSLTVHVQLLELHSTGSGMAADILAQCSNLKYLRICCTFKMENDLKSPFLCNHQDNWKSVVVYYLPHLKEVEFMGLAGTECELWFMQSMLASTTQLHKVTISFHPESSLQNRIHAFERITPLQEHGMWTCCREPYLSFEWKPSR